MKQNRRTFLKGAASASAFNMAASGQREAAAAAVPEFSKGAVRATGFESRPVYHSSQKPGYACWVSFFPGERGHWYLTCEEVTRPAKPYPKMSDRRFYEFGLPTGYDKAPLQMEIVMLESRDTMKSWKVISREPVRFQHSAGSFGQARTRDGRFLRFVWNCYALGDKPNPGDILRTSSDGGRTWRKEPEFHDARFSSYPHRLRTLRDGTLVLALPLFPAWGAGTEFPMRTCRNINAASNGGMHLCFSADQGRTWTQPLPIYAGRVVSETDFVELPSGDLLCINSSIFADPGRQIIHRTRHGFVAGTFEKSDSPVVPETVAITENGLLVGCLRNSHYLWSDDLGRTWFPLEGIPVEIAKGRETYQPWIHYLGEGRFANAGHWGGDNAPGQFDQYVMIHFFNVEVLRKTANTRIELVRDFDEATHRWKNAYTLTLTCDGAPLAGKDLQVWFVERDKPGYDSRGNARLEDRMKAGGELMRVRTGAGGLARFDIARLDAIRNQHYSYQLVARFNADRSDPDYKPAITPEFEFYADLTH
jgi:hypothetical protein